ncbi:unnamed protein product, partial [Prorocentrum cordatum]
MLIARRDAEYQIKRVDEAIIRIGKKQESIREQLEAAQATAKQVTAQLEDLTDQLDGIKRTKVEILEMQEVEQECEEDVATQQAMHDRYMARGPMSGLPVWRAQQPLDAKMGQKLKASLEPTQQTLHMAALMQSMAAATGTPLPGRAIPAMA